MTTTVLSNRLLRTIPIAVIMMLTIFVCTARAATVTTVHSFSPGLMPADAYSRLVLGADGSFFGTSAGGGDLGRYGGSGTVFKVTAAGAVTVLHKFEGTDGSLPFGGLAVDPSTGDLYGTTEYGGTLGTGTVFMITPGGTFTSLYSFATSVGEYPYQGLTYLDGNFYGAVGAGGANGFGAIFEVTPAGKVTNLYSVTSADGKYPNCTMAAGNGVLYGTTEEGGAGNDGTVFKFSLPDTYTTIASFDATDGAGPSGPLTLGQDGNIYGVTADGGSAGSGTVFKVTPAGVITNVHSFVGTDGSYPVTGVVEVGDGVFYGTAVAGGANNDGTLFSVTSAGGFSLLHSFDGADGKNPYGGVIAANEVLYGDTESNTNGAGIVYSSTLAGAVTKLASFTYTDGAFVQAPLIRGSDGNFYGATEYGGASNDGTVYKMTPGGVVTILHSFDYADGAQPFGGLVQGVDGYLYGTCYDGGANDATGTVFKISTTGAFTLLHSFNGAGDGIRPECTLIQGSDHNFYGATVQGGTGSDGTIFRITPAGVFTVIHSFTGPDGDDCLGLTDGHDGYFYGTTIFGGAHKVGNIFRITPAGTFTSLYSFTGGAVDGEDPIVPPTLASDGYFYGMSAYYGANGEGAIYKMAPSGTPITFIAQLAYDTTGYSGFSPFVEGSDGLLYATNYYGGTDGAGIIFAVSTSGAITTLFSFDGTDGFGPDSALLPTAPGVFYGTTQTGGGQNAGTIFKLAIPATEPKELTAVNDDGKVVLTWKAGMEQTTYNVYRGVKSGGESPAPLASGLTTTSFTDTTVTDGTTYFYTVAGVNGNGPGAMSNEAAVVPVVAAATFVKIDGKTQGSWKGVYGIDGFDVIGDKSSNNPTYPRYAAVAESGESNVVWTAASTEPYALEAAAKGSAIRLLGADYAATTFTVDINVKNGQSQPIEIYLVDWLDKGRSETITVKDTVKGAILDTRTASAFDAGVYYDYDVKGDVTIAITRKTGPNAVISGLFFK